MVKNCEDRGHSFSPYRPPSRQIIYVYIEHRAELKLSRHLPNCTISGTFLHVFFFFFESEISEQSSRQIALEEPKQRFVNMPGAVIDVIIT